MLKVVTIILVSVAAAMTGMAWFRGSGVCLSGLKLAGGKFLEVLPLLLAGFVVAGMLQTLLPREVVARWLGDEAGMKGVLLGCLAGGLTPGAPFMNYPIAAALYHSGASVGTLVAYVTAWSLWAGFRFPLEVAYVGMGPTLVRLASTFFFPPVAGALAMFLSSRLGIR